MAGPGRFRRWILRPVSWALAALALVVAGLVLFLESDFARERARQLVRARLEDALRREVTIERLDFRLLPFAVELEGVTVAGDAPGARPFARLRRLAVEGELEGFGRSELVLSAVEIDGLDLYLEFRAGGSDNIPRPRRTGGGGELRLRVDGVRVADSEVTVAERTVPVDVAARSVVASLVGLGGLDLQGEVSAREVELLLPSARPLPLALAAKARLTRSGLEILEARVDGTDLAARVTGQIGFAPTVVDLGIALDGAGSVVDRLGYLDGEIAGPVEVEGRFEWRREAWGFRGSLASPALDLFGFRLEQLAGSVAVERRAVHVDVARGRFEGGAVQGAFEVDLEPGRYPARLEVGLAGADLARVLARFGLPGERLAGEVNGTFRHDFELAGARRGSGSGDFDVLPIARAGADGLPATGAARLALEDRRLLLPALELATPGVRASASGTWDLEAGAGTFDFEANAEDLAELATLAELGAPGDLWRPVSGTGVVSGRVAVDRRGLRADLQLACAAVAAPGMAAERLSGSLVATGEAIEAMDLAAAGDDGAQLSLVGRLPLAGDGLDLLVRAEHWPLDQARPWLPFELPVDGAATGTLRLTGALDSIAGDLEATLAPATVEGVALGRIEGRVRFDPETVELVRGALSTPAGRLEASGRLGVASGSLDFGFAAAALDLGAEPFAGPLAGRAAGRLRLAGSLGGTLEAPVATVEATSDDLVLPGGPAAAGERARATVRLADGRLALEATIGDLLTAAGAGAFDPSGATEIELDVASARLDRWLDLAGAGRIEGLAGELAGTLTLAASPGQPLTAALELPRLEVRTGGRILEALEPVRAVWQGDRLELESLYLGASGASDELFLSGTVELADSPRLDLRVQASVGAAVLRPLLGGHDIAGRLDLLAVVRGAPDHPELNGQASLADGRWILAGVPHSFERVRGLALFYPRAVVLDRLDAAFAGGELTVAGRVDLPVAAEPSYRFDLAARRLALRYPAGWLLRGDADLALASTPEGRQLRGEVRLDRAFYLQDVALSPAQLIQRLLTKGRVEEVATDDLSATTSLGIVVEASGALRVRNNIASLSGGGELTVRGTLARPVVFGELAVDPRGRVEYGGNSYELERARVLFANPTRIEPVLDVVARTRIDPYLVTVRLDGPLAGLETTFTAEPPLPDLDVLGLIAGGAPLQPDALSGYGGGRGTGAEPGGAATAQAAETLLYGQAASLLSARVHRLFGLDTVRIDPLTVGDAVSTARVTVGKRVARDLFVTYSYDPSTTAQQILQVEWRIDEKLTLVLTQNGNDSYAVDARWETRY